MTLPRWFSPSLLCCWALAGAACFGCVSRPKPFLLDTREAIQRRAEAWFSNAVLFKPGEPLFPNELGFRLAPLLVQEVAPANAAAVTNAAPLILLFAEGQTRIAGQPYRQVTFVWEQPVAGRRVRGASASWQGLRLTLNAAGQPAIWEVLRDGSGMDVFFVSQSAEAAALRAFGPSLPGRRFAVERAIEETPNTVVARIIDDAPVAMGPIVHLNSSGDITTVNCRCMTTQAGQLVGQGGYGLVTDPSAAAPWSRSGPTSAGSRPLDQVLRLPAGF